MDNFGINIKLENFEGPMDLLYGLIIKNKIDIYDIPISLITDQYLACIDRYEQDNLGKTMDSMSEFVVMAATLIEIKSKMLLPKSVNENDEEIDPREELVKRLIEYKHFKHLAQSFNEKLKLSGFSYYKKSDCDLIKRIKSDVPHDISDILNNADMEMLFNAFEDVLRRQEVKTDKIRSGFNSVERERYTVESKIEYISNMLKLNESISFADLFWYNPDRYTVHKGEIIAAFLAMLELIKTKKISVTQQVSFDDIIITAYTDNMAQIKTTGVLKDEFAGA